MNSLKKVGVGLVIALFLLASLYFIRIGIASRKTPVEKEMETVESHIAAIGEEDRITELEQSGIKEGDLLEKMGTSLTGTKPVFGFDTIKIRYYYIAYPCFDVRRRCDQLLGSYAELEHDEDINGFPCQTAGSP